MVPLCSEKNYLLLLFWSRLVHAALAMHATLAALGTIFKASPALCTCEPRHPRGEMQAVPCGARSDTRLFPACGSQPRSAQIRPVRTYLILKSKRSLHFSDTSSYPARKKAPAHPDAFARASTNVRPRGGRAPVSPCLHPCPRTHGEIRGRNGPGRRAREPHTNRK